MTLQLPFDPEVFLSNGGAGPTKCTYEEDKVIFSQGEPMTSRNFPKNSWRTF